MNKDNKNSFWNETKIFGLSETVKHRALSEHGVNLQPLEDGMKLSVQVLGIAAAGEVLFWLKLAAPYYFEIAARAFLAGFPK